MGLAERRGAARTNTHSIQEYRQQVLGCQATCVKPLLPVLDTPGQLSSSPSLRSTLMASTTPSRPVKMASLCCAKVTLATGSAPLRVTRELCGVSMSTRMPQKQQLEPRTSLPRGGMHSVEKRSSLFSTSTLSSQSASATTAQHWRLQA